MSRTLRYFKEITQYPRPSKQEEKIRDFLVSWAQKREYRYQVDQIGNLIVYVPAKNSNSKEIIILQSHMDMVCVKTPESTHNFLTDSIQTYEKNGFLHAHSTTLGADNGIGIALSMVACDFESHPALELVFTIDEEEGMSGIENLDFSLLSGKKVINLDSESEDEICISSAGGMGIIPRKKLEYSLNTNTQKYKLSISGMQGGHSGVEIHKNRGNTIIVLLNFIARYASIEDIYGIEWGTASNVIPSKVEAIIWIVNKVEFMVQMEEYLQEVKRTFDCPEIAYLLEENYTSSLPISGGIELMRDIAHIKTGVYAMSVKIPGLVETSMNLGIIEIKEGVLELTYHARSSVNTELSHLSGDTKAHFLKRGYEVESDTWYPGWQDDPDSLLLQITKEEACKILGKEPKVVALHAGLECGAMVSSLSDWVNAISIGPNMFEIHSVNERVEIASIEKVERILEGILRRL